MFLRLGPSRRWYLIGSALFATGLILAYTAGYVMHTERMDAAAGYQRGDDGRSARLTVTEAGTYTVWLEVLVGQPQPAAVRGPLPRLAQLAVTTEDGKRVAARPSTASDYRITVDGQTRIGKAIGDVTVPAGALVITVNPGGDARAVAVGREPAVGARGLPAAGGFGLAVTGVLAWIVTGMLRRFGSGRFAAARRAALGPQGPQGG